MSGQHMAARARQTRVVHAWLLSLSLGCIGAGCQQERTSSRLITLETSERVEDDPRALYMRGSGFPTGRSGELGLEGSIYVPGAPRRSLEGHGTCRALSDFRARCDLRDVMAEQPAPGMFEGRLTLTFPDDSGVSRIEGSLAGARVRVPSARGFGTAEQLDLARRARAFQRSLGIAEVETAPLGVAIVRLDAQSAAARDGVATGDVVLRIDDAPVEQPSDLLGRDAAREVRLWVLPKNAQAPREVRLATGDTRARLLLWLLAALGALAGALVPLRGRALGHLFDHTWERASFAWCGVLVTVSLLCTGALDVRPLWLAPLFLRLAWLARQHLQNRFPVHVSLQECVELCLQTLAITALGVGHGSLQTAWFAADGGSLPWHWALYGLPSTWLVILILAGRPRTVAAEHALDTQTRALLHAGRLCMLASFGLGDGQGAPDLVTSALGSWLLSACVFAAKLPLAAILLNGQFVQLRRPWRVSLGLLAPVLALVCGRVLLAFPGIAELLGACLFGASIGALTPMFARKLGGKSAPLRDPALSPFL